MTLYQCGFCGEGFCTVDSFAGPPRNICLIGDDEAAFFELVSDQREAELEHQVTDLEQEVAELKDRLKDEGVRV